MTIERRGRSHRAVCGCGWVSHAWNELRPAEADAWHHVFGDEVIVDVSPDQRPAPAPPPPPPPPPTVEPAGPDRFEETARTLAVEQLVRHAQELADRPSPYSREAAPELWRAAERDGVLVQAAIAQLEELLARHDRQASRAADSEWLKLITAKRLLAQAAAHGEQSGARRALL